MKVAKAVKAVKYVKGKAKKAASQGKVLVRFNASGNMGKILQELTNKPKKAVTFKRLQSIADGMTEEQVKARAYWAKKFFRDIHEESGWKAKLQDSKKIKNAVVYFPAPITPKVEAAIKAWHAATPRKAKKVKAKVKTGKKVAKVSEKKPVQSVKVVKAVKKHKEAA